MTDHLEKHGSCFVNASSSGKMPKLRGHVQVHSHI